MRVVEAIGSTACRCDVLSLLFFQRVQPALENTDECCRHGQDYNNHHSCYRDGRVQRCVVAAVVIRLRCASCQSLSFQFVQLNALTTTTTLEI